MVKVMPELVAPLAVPTLMVEPAPVKANVPPEVVALVSMFKVVFAALNIPVVPAVPEPSEAVFQLDGLLKVPDI